MKVESGEHFGQEQPGILGFYLRNIGANLFGFVCIVVLNAFTPTDFFRESRFYLFEEGGGSFIFFIRLSQL